MSLAQPVVRAQAVAALKQANWDVIVVGGGITGAGMALEAAKRGLRVLLLEQRDFAWGTSSRSSKMVHGGLRYLASGDFKLTLDAVRERKRLLQEAPGLVENLHFVMPHYQGGFPGPALFSKVLTLYDFMAGKQNHEFYAAKDAALWVSGLKNQRLLGLTRFADAVVDDARLVLRVLQEAKSQGAWALNYMQVQKVQGSAAPAVEVQDAASGGHYRLQAKVVINATGAWTDKLRAQLGQKAVVRPLRGSHLLLPFWRLPVACALSFAHPKDKRPVFVFPWQGMTVIGTTDLDHKDDLNTEASISSAEMTYLLEAVNSALPDAHLRREDIQASMAGVRPVVAGSSKDPSKEKREHAIWDDGGVLSVAGGKLTTFRLIALDVLKQAQRYLPPMKDAANTLFNQPNLHPPKGLMHSHWQRLLGHYGEHALTVAALGAEPVANTDTLWGELKWALTFEAVQHLDDLLLRRTRLGLLLPQGAQELEQALAALCQEILGWNAQTFFQEWTRYQTIWQRHYAVPL